MMIFSVRGLEVGDVDGNGENDLVVSSLDRPVEVYRFVDGVFQTPDTLSETVGGNRATALIDFDEDGDLDLYVARSGEDMVFFNNGDNTFTRLQEFAGYTGESRSTSLYPFTNTKDYLGTDTGVRVANSGRPLPKSVEGSGTSTSGTGTAVGVGVVEAMTLAIEEEGAEGLR